ncbi:MAG TPA: UDP-N-acetylmuramoyl-L-alanine--D-glutamate ligase [Cytophagales bacterium]|nr:UDP-N-acetylmuramoyl-L-alanine--D-glutamate ligase [Cytophagales bacterium]
MKGSIVILGAGESGTGAALLAEAMGYSVFVSDMGKLGANYHQELEQAGIAFEEGRHTEDMVFSADIIVKSPGIPDTAPLIVSARAKDIPIISEIEFAGKFIPEEAKTVLITGTNGKTTTTMLTHHILVQAGKKAALGGNVGTALSRLVLKGGYDVYVIEVSSFQLDGMFDFHANYATVLNVTPDHLDRYDYQMQRYTDSKFRVLQNMAEDDHFVYCLEAPVVADEIEKRQPKAHLHPVTTQEDFSADAYVNGETLVVKAGPDEWYYHTVQMTLQGPHNEINAMVAATFARLLGADKEDIRQGLNNFSNAPHRMEPVGTIKEVEFINDSKGTNVDAVKQSLASFPGKSIVWVAGGIDKGNDYSQLESLVREKVRATVLLGKDNEKLRAFSEGLGKPVKETQDVNESVKLSLDFAQPGDVVLLSPACSSFDLFNNFAERGDLWRIAVMQLTNNSIDD